MNKVQPPKKSINKVRRALFVILTVVTVLATGCLIYYFTLQGMNEAKTAVSPLEKAIIAAGGTKQCEAGDGGHGPDNSEPWYQVYLSVEKNEEDTVKLLQKYTSENGYELVRATPQNRGPLAIADAYVDKWYFDTNKSGPYQLTAAINANGLSSACPGKTLLIDSFHSLIGIDVNIRR